VRDSGASLSLLLFMCEICNLLQSKDKVYHDSEKWLIVDTPNGAMAIWKKHSPHTDCDTCLLWIQLKCRELFGKKCRYSYDMEKLKEHFCFYVSEAQ
jgi:hypothetical protein